MKFTAEDVEAFVQEPVETFIVDKGTNVIDNNCSELLQITVTTKSGKTINLVCKSLPTGQGIKEFAIADKIFWRENIFYSTLSPNIQSTLKSYLSINLQTIKLEVIITQLQLPIPKYFSGLNNDDTDYVCLEDLRPQGFKMPDKTVGLTLQECSLTLKKLAQFHALSYFYLKHQGEGVFQLIDSYKVYHRKHVAVEQPQLFRGLLELVYRNSISLIKNHCTASDKDELVSKMTGENDSVITSSYATITSTTSNTDSKYFPLFIHGDLWLNNLLFSYAANGEPEDVKFIDFQFSRRGNIYEDLNYFFSTSTTAQFRKLHLETSLDVYYNSFISTLSAINFPLPLNFTRTKFFEGFYENILPSYLHLSLFMPLQLGKASEDGSNESVYTDELVKKMERNPLALRRWEDSTREVVQLGFL